LKTPQTNQERVRAISGRHNPLLKALRRAYTHGLTDDNCFAVEGVRMIEEAIRSSIRLRTVFFSDTARARQERLLSQINSKVDVVELPDELFRSAVGSESPQGVAALVERKPWSLEDALLKSSPPLVVVAAGLQDPGNLGTLIRSAEAFGAGGVLLGEGTVNVFNAKTVRATAGSVFRLPLVEGKIKDFIAALREHAVKLVATTSHKGTAVAAVNLSVPVAILVGNEGAGLPHELLRQMDELVTIPHTPQVESLNAGIAASVMLYEASRQRGQKK
jgi:TrmH family RNA methyltransferase